MTDVSVGDNIVSGFLQKQYSLVQYYFMNNFVYYSHQWKAEDYFR